MIDWKAPLEAVEPNGRIVLVQHLSRVGSDEHYVEIDGMNVVVDPSGRLRDGAQIRNVQSESLLDDAAEARRICDASPYRLDPEVSTSVTNGHIYDAVLAGVQRGRQLRTSDDALRRMEALVERMAAAFHDSNLFPSGNLKPDNLAYIKVSEFMEAKAIQALRNPPIDPRLTIVVTSLVQNGVSRPVAPLFARDVLKALDATS